MPEKLIYVKRGANVSGPFAISRIIAAINKSQVAPSDLMSAAVSGPWMPCTREMCQRFDDTLDGDSDDWSLGELVQLEKQADPITRPDAGPARSVLQEIIYQARENWARRGQSTSPRGRHQDKVHREGLNPLVVYIALGALLIGGPVLYRLRAISKPVSNKSSASVSVDADVRVTKRYREKFAALYDTVKGVLASRKQILLRDVPRFTQELKAQAALVPKEEHPSLHRIGSKLRFAATALVRELEVSQTMGSASVDLSDSEFGRTALAKAATYVKVQLEAAEQALVEVENDPVFPQIIR